MDIRHPTRRTVRKSAGTRPGLRHWIMMALTLSMVLFGIGKTAGVWAATTWSNGEFGPGIIASLDNAGVLTISGTGPMNMWSSGTSPVYPVRTSVKSIVIEAGVTTIGAYCFQGCTAMTAVSIDASVTDIYGSSFTNCTSVTAMTIPPNVHILYSNTFYGCSKLSVVHLPHGLTQIGYSAFAYCPKLTTVTIPETVTSIVGSAFRYCAGLTSIIIPDSVTTVSVCAFQGCTGLLSAVIGSGCTLMGDYVFDGCANLSSVDIGSGVKIIGYNAFKNCSKLANIINRYDGNQTIDSTAFSGAGSSISTKTASCSPLNTRFVAIITAAGYTLATMDVVPPEATHTLSPDCFTGLPVTVTIHATDNIAVEKIRLPDGSEVYDDTAAFTVAENGTYPFLIQDTSGNLLAYPVVVSNICGDISVTCPDSVSCLIDPNQAIPFTASALELVNHAPVPVSVSVLSLSTIPGGSLVLNDVAPSAFSDWTLLTRAQTRSNIAVCVGVQESGQAPGGWASIDQATPLYGVQIQGKTILGVLEANGGTGHLCLSALCGLAWDTSETVNFSIALVFDAVG